MEFNIQTYRRHFRKINDTYWHRMQLFYQWDPVVFEALVYAVSFGKSLRPLWIYALNHAYEGSRNSADNLALAVECLHAASLVHDDLPCIDNDTLRRGQATLHVRFGEGTAVLIGDLLPMLGFKALEQWQQLAVSKDFGMQPYHWLTQANIALLSGQLMDISGQDFSDTQKKQLFELKTASLFKLSLKLGLVSAGINNAQTFSAIDTLAHLLGLAYQYQDDMQDQLDAVESLKNKQLAEDYFNQAIRACQALPGVKRPEALENLITEMSKPIRNKM